MKLDSHLLSTLLLFPALLALKPFPDCFALNAPYSPTMSIFSQCQTNNNPQKTSFQATQISACSPAPSIYILSYHIPQFPHFRPGARFADPHVDHRHALVRILFLMR
jgi:hypothetical protein